jgi:HlyD family secretion protein
MKLNKPLTVSTTTPPAARAPRRRSGNLLVVLALVALAAGGGFVAYRQYTQQQEARIAAAQVRTVTARRENVRTTVSASGTVVPLISVNISPKASGRVAAIYVKEGQRVRKGTLLAQIDDSNLRGQLLQAEGQLASAQANLQKALAGFRPEEVSQAAAAVEDARAALAVARSNYEQDQALFQQGAISERILNNSRAQRDRAEAQLAQAEEILALRNRGTRREDIAVARAQVTVAQGSVQTIRTQIADLRLYAPIDGLISRIYADVGSIVSPVTPSSNFVSSISSSVMNLAGEAIVRVNVAESDIPRIRVGQSVAISADAFPGRTFQGRVREVAPQSTTIQNVTSFEVKITLTDPQASVLRTGMSVDAEFVIGTLPQALMIPTVAIVRLDNRTGVYIKGEKDQPEFRAMRPGVTIGNQTQVLSGLTEAEQIFISFPPGFKPEAKSGGLPGMSLRGGAAR